MGVFLKVRPKNLTIWSYIKSTALIFLYRFLNDKIYIMKLLTNKALSKTYPIPNQAVNQ